MSLLLKNYSVTKEEKKLLQTISFELPIGEIHVLMGPNGAGKSTLSNALSGHPLYSEDGEIIIDGQSVLTRSAEERAKAGLFVSFQQAIPIPGLSYVQFIKAAKSALTGEQLDPIVFYKELVALAESQHIDPTLLQKNVGDNLSGGERKKLELLQILALKPKYLILDEIDAGLDITSVASITEAINEYVQHGHAALVITHHPEIAELFNPQKVYILNKGSIVKVSDKHIITEIKKDGYKQYV